MTDAQDDGAPEQRRPLTFIGIMSSGERDLSVRNEEILREELGDQR